MNSATQIIQIRISQLQKEKKAYQLKFKEASKSGQEDDANFYEKEAEEMGRAIYELEKVRCQIARLEE